jgi:hypothetical protein
MKPGDVLRIGAALFQVPRVRPSQMKISESEGLSDDEISTWLTEDEGQTNSASVPDTTVIKGRSPAASTPAAPAASVTPSQPDARLLPTIRQPPKSVKEQAADIIRKHWEIVRGQQSE